MGDIPSFGDRQVYGGALAAPTYINWVYLEAAGTAETINLATIATATGETPAIIIFTPLYEDTVFFARYDGSAATLPAAADVTDGTGSEINPMIRSVRNIASISLISPQAGATIQYTLYSDDAEAELNQ